VGALGALGAGVVRARLFVHTARHLRPRQLAWLLLRRRTSRPRPADRRAWAPWNGEAARALAALGPVDTPAAVMRRVAAFRQGRAEMLGHSVPWERAWLEGEAPNPLWRFHLDYHDVLAEAAWVASDEGDPALAGAVAAALSAWAGGARRDRAAWHPYPVSVRLVNWLRIAGWIGPYLPPDLQRTLRDGHMAHVAHLRRNLEWGLQGNHLLRNAWALVLGSHAWDGPRAAAVRPWAKELFYSEMLAQVGADGVHEERSPMYHVRALRDALEAVAVLTALDVAVPRPVVERIRTMAEAVPWLQRSDGALFLLNDSANDHGVDTGRLLETAGHLVGHQSSRPSGVRAFPDARLVAAAEPGVGDRLLVDLGGPGPPHQPGHSHAGALALDLDLAMLPFLVDPGCSGYDGDPFRPYFRGTRAHNTATIDRKDQSEMWATFRVARRAVVTLETISGDVGNLVVRGACSPYHDPAATHERTIRRTGRTVLIEDQVTGARGRRVDVHWHLDPGWSVERAGSDLACRHRDGTKALLRMTGADEITLHRGEREPTLGWYALGFGRACPTWTVRGTVHANDGRVVRTVIEPATPHPTRTTP
jgi:hypothetical protein